MADCTGAAASWCDVHGACTCPDPHDRNDAGCPLHSRASTHAQPKDLADYIHDHIIKVHERLEPLPPGYRYEMSCSLERNESDNNSVRMVTEAKVVKI